MKNVEKVFYTIGIIFDEKLEKVILILKNRPKWQKGKFNFPGGHVEKDESIFESVSREIKEECNLDIPDSNWYFIGRMSNPDENYIVNILTTKYNLSFGILKTNEDQTVDWFYINELNSPKCKTHLISNLQWLIPMIIHYWNHGNNPDYLSFIDILYTNRNSHLQNEK